MLWFTLPMLWFLYFLVPFGFVGIITYGFVSLSVTSNVLRLGPARDDGGVLVWAGRNAV
jgi:hypothetical protein